MFSRREDDRPERSKTVFHSRGIEIQGCFPHIHREILDIVSQAIRPRRIDFRQGACIPIVDDRSQLDISFLRRQRIVPVCHDCPTQFCSAGVGREQVVDDRMRPVDIVTVIERGTQDVFSPVNNRHGYGRVGWFPFRIKNHLVECTQGSIDADM